MSQFMLCSQLEVKNHCVKNLKRELTEDEQYILSFAYRRGVDAGKQKLLDCIIENLTKESEVKE